MIKIEKTEVFGWEAAIRGMRNPLNSWDKSDCFWKIKNTDYGSIYEPIEFVIGENDLSLMKRLAKAGSDHGKFLRMINVTCDITSALYWWKEYDTYKVSTVANSCSTMHKIHDKEFTLDDFSHEHLLVPDKLGLIIDWLNSYRQIYMEYEDGMTDVDGQPITKKDIWWQMIQLLPSSYNQKRTVQLNYQVLKNMYHARKNHKLDEWHDFCDWIESLPYSELITGEEQCQE